MKNSKSFIIQISLLVLLLPLFSCQNDSDKLLGSWSDTFALTDDYSVYRTLNVSDRRYTYLHTFKFSKDEKTKEGYFLDVISPIAVSQDKNDIVLGSKIKGTWEVKKGKLYLYYDKALELLNCENIGSSDKLNIESQMLEAFLEDFGKLGKNGLKYEINDDKNSGKQQLVIYFGNLRESFIKREQNN